MTLSRMDKWAQRGRKTILPLAILAVLPGCMSDSAGLHAIGQTDYEEIGAVPLDFSCLLADACNTDPTTIQTFDDLVLAANAYSPNVLEARNDMARAFDRLASAKRSRFFTPSVRVTAMASGGVATGVQLSQPIWHGGRLNGQIELATIEAVRAIRAYDVLRFELIEKIVGGYQALDEVDRTLAVRQRELAELNDVKAMISARVEGALDTADSLGSINVKIASLEHTSTELQLNRQSQLDKLREEIGVVISLDETAMPAVSGAELLRAANAISNAHSAGRSTVFETYADLNVTLFEAQERVDASKVMPAVDFVVSWDVTSTPQIGLQSSSNFEPLFYDPAMRYPTIRSLEDALERQNEAERLANMRVAYLLHEARTLSGLLDAAVVRQSNARQVFEIEADRYKGQGGSTSQLIGSREVLSDAEVQTEKLRSRMSSIFIRLKAYERSFVSPSE